LSVTTIRFPVRVGFHARVKQRVHQYFADNRKPKTGDWRLFLKTGVMGRSDGVPTRRVSFVLEDCP
jgi:hypothetical protein